MDGSSFDRLARLAATGTGRRGLLRIALGLAGGGLAATSLLAEESDAAKSCKQKCKKKDNKDARKKCKKKCKKQTGQCRSEGEACSPEGNDQQCCRDQNLVCDIEFGDSGGDSECCRGTGASCTPPGTSGPKCCTGEAGRREFQCVNGICQECAGGLCP
jgi:hypothetical protein